MLKYEEEKSRETSLKQDYEKKLQEIEEKETEVKTLESGASSAKANSEAAYAASVDSSAQAIALSANASGLSALSSHLSRKALISVEARMECEKITSTTAQVACLDTAANEELGHVAGERCEVVGGARKKCEESLCCGQGLRPEVSLAPEATVVIETCQPPASTYYYHQQTATATRELWSFNCIEGAKYIASALSAVVISSLYIFE